VVTKILPTSSQNSDLLFGEKCVKHLKSNAIALVKNKQLIGMGCGQTSRVDALKQAIAKSKSFGFDLSGGVMASDAFFPFSDCVEIAGEEKISAIIQPGGSVRDQDSIDACNRLGIAMVITGLRHFLH
jgi:phosphoribosylaminoimidazolecarboxamide formyltransferase/IMP cyclohydrolase